MAARPASADGGGAGEVDGELAAFEQRLADADGPRLVVQRQARASLRRAVRSHPARADLRPHRHDPEVGVTGRAPPATPAGQVRLPDPRAPG